jgi:hypothetical protein
VLMRTASRKLRNVSFCATSFGRFPPWLELTFVCFFGPFVGQHAIKGATKEKSRKLDELKAKRKAKDEKKRVWAFLSFVLSSF